MAGGRRPDGRDIARVALAAALTVAGARDSRAGPAPSNAPNQESRSDQGSPATHPPAASAKSGPIGVLHPDLRWEDHIAVLPLAADGELFDGERCLRIEYESPWDGWIYVSAFSDEAEDDCWVKVLDLDGALVAADDDSAGGNDAFLELPVAEGDYFEILVGHAGAARGTIRTRFFEDESDRSALRTLMDVEKRAALAFSGGRWEESRQLLEEAVRWEERCRRALPPDHLDLLRARGSMSATFGQFGEYGAALEYGRATLASAERYFRDDLDHPEVQRARNNLAVTWRQLGEYGKARGLEEATLASRERYYTDDPDHPNLQRSRSNLALTLCRIGEFERALELTEAAMQSSLRRFHDQQDHPEVQNSRVALAAVAARFGDLDRVRALEEAVLASRERFFQGQLDHPDVQRARSNLADTLADLGELERACELRQAALAERERFYRNQPDHPELLGLRSRLAISLRERGELERARVVGEAAVESAERVFRDQPDHPSLQIVRHNLAVTIRRLGDLERARVLQEAVLASAARTFDPDHPELQTARGNLALTLLELGEPSQSLVLQEAVLASLQRRFHDQLAHPDVRLARTNVAVTLVALGEHARARELLVQSLHEDSPIAPSEFDGVRASAQTTLARVLLDLGEIDAARAMAETVLVDVEHAHRDQLHAPNRQATRRMAAIARTRTGDTAGAMELTTRLIERVETTLQHFENSAPHSWEALARSSSGVISWALSFTRVFPDAGDLELRLFRAVESARCVAASRARFLSLVPLDAADAVRARELRRTVYVKHERIRRALESPTPGPRFHEVVAELRQEERELTDLVERAAEESGLEWSTDPRDIANALAPGSAGIGYWRYWRQDIDPVSFEISNGRWAYCAWVLRPDAPLIRIELCDEQDLQAAMERSRELVHSERSREVSSRKPQASPSLLREAGEEIRRLVFDPLVVHLDGVHDVLLALDGQLHLVPFEALPRSDGRLVDRWRLSRRNTLKELTASAEPRHHPPSLLVIGGIDYDSSIEARGRSMDPARGNSVTPEPTFQQASPSERAIEVRSLSPSDSRATPLDASMQFRRLPSSHGEALDVADLFEECFGAEHLHHSTGAAATRSGLGNRARNVRFLHLATHGYFVPESFRSAADPEPLSQSFPDLYRSDPNTQVSGMLPMALCGLALAGANQPPGETGIREGIVTAEELSHLDLSGCELVVLSACDTNVGLVRASQGIASLQQALYAAGAHATITSLWKVPDDATRKLMKRFYENWWLRGMSKSAALQQAQKWMREARDPTSGELLHRTRDWAAWVLVGDGR